LFLQALGAEAEALAAEAERLQTALALAHADVRRWREAAEGRAAREGQAGLAAAMEETNREQAPPPPPSPSIPY
jgi:hypothetical protein